MCTHLVLTYAIKNAFWRNLMICRLGMDKDKFPGNLTFDSPEYRGTDYVPLLVFAVNRIWPSAISVIDIL